jgi:hypothetical protein
VARLRLSGYARIAPAGAAANLASEPASLSHRPLALAIVILGSYWLIARTELADKRNATCHDGRA